MTFFPLVSVFVSLSAVRTSLPDIYFRNPAAKNNKRERRRTETKINKHEPKITTSSMMMIGNRSHATNNEMKQHNRENERTERKRKG
jgi:hypothetical protein